MIQWLIKQAIFSFVATANTLQVAFVGSESLYKFLLIPHAEKARWKIGAWRAWYNAEQTYRSVPAYRKFIRQHAHGWPKVRVHKSLPDLSIIPETDKESYVKKYSTEDRCVGGVIPRAGVVVDESSGSSGTPTSWVRGPEERKVSKQLLQLSYHSALGSETFFVINAFALGAWATGLNVSMAMSEISIIKSTGPDIDKIINTINAFGPKYRYIIMGYPPFLKTLADDPRLEWHKLNIIAFYGGEGMSESMRDYLLKNYKEVMGSYGASDLEINMAAENNFTIHLRRLILKHPELRDRLIYTDWGVTPMIFQYNPLSYYVETNDKGELIFTMTRITNIAPKVRYNIHDRGHVLRYPELKKILKELNLWQEFKTVTPKLELPILFHYGRSDMSIDYYGANVTPDSVREVLYGIHEVAERLESFRLISYEDKQHNKRMRVAIELNKGRNADELDAKKVAEQFWPALANMNRDFYNALYHTATADEYPEVTVHEYATGPFEGGDRKLKKEYVTTNLKYDSF
jgi:phenylacetate-CoA ligase